MTRPLYWILFIAAILFTACNETVENSSEQEESKTDTAETKSQDSEALSQADLLSAIDQYKETTDQLENLTIVKKRYQNPDEAHDQEAYTIYNQGDKMVKLVQLLGEMPYRTENIYYFKDGQLQLVHQKSYYDGDPEVEDKLFNDLKVFFNEGKIFATVGKSIPEDAKGSLDDVAAETTMVDADSELVSSWTQQVKRLRDRIQKATTEQ